MLFVYCVLASWLPGIVQMDGFCKAAFWPLKAALPNQGYYYFGNHKREFFFLL